MLDDETQLNLLKEPAAIACGERPQERFETFGVRALSDTELLALILQNGIRGPKVLALSSQLLAEAGSLKAMACWHPSDFRRLNGIGRAKGQQLAAVIELARRIMNPEPTAARLLNRPENVAAYFAPMVAGLDIEKFWVVCLNRKNRLRRIVEVTSGTATSTLAHPREVFRAAIREGAASICCVHNHPSGDPAPSDADMQVTRQLREASKAVDIDLQDHIIIGTATADPIGLGYYSFREAGIL